MTIIKNTASLDVGKITGVNTAHVIVSDPPTEMLNPDGELYQASPPIEIKASINKSATQLMQQHANQQFVAAIRDLYYNAVFELDVTAQPAPPSLPRARFWHVDMVGALEGAYDYKRYFYLTAAQAQENNPTNAVAAWIINQKQVSFEYIESGVVIHTEYITDEEGQALISTFRPIHDERSVWFFGPNMGANAFPDADNIRSILDINVPALNTIIGNSFNLSTVSKELVGAINELYLMHKDSRQVKITDEDTPDSLEGAIGDIAITPHGIYARKIINVSTGFQCTSSDHRFNGIWSDMGKNLQNTNNGMSLDTHWYLHESGNFVIVWSNWNNNPNTPRAGYWFINNVSTPRLDLGALVRNATQNIPLPSTVLPPNTGWGITMEWSNYTGSVPSGLGWELVYDIRSTPDNRMYVGNKEVPIEKSAQTVVADINATTINIENTILLTSTQLSDLGIISPTTGIKSILIALSCQEYRTTAALSSLTLSSFTGQYYVPSFVNFSVYININGDLIVNNSNGVAMTFDTLTISFVN